MNKVYVLVEMWGNEASYEQACEGAKMCVFSSMAKAKEILAEHMNEILNRWRQSKDYDKDDEDMFRINDYFYAIYTDRTYKGEIIEVETNDADGASIYIAPSF